MIQKFKIKNLKLKIEEGFTLLEMTIVMGIFLVIGTIIVSILSSTFNGNTKVRVSNNVAQNGNYALSIISNLLINSQQFESIETGSTVTTLCSSSGTTGKAVSVTGFDGGVTKLSCKDTGTTPEYTISSNSAILIDKTQVQLATDSTCMFTCTQVDEFSPPRIDIVFTLKNSTGTAAEKTGSATFRTSVSLRNQDLR